MAQDYHYQHDDTYPAALPSRQSTPVSPLLPSQRLPLLRTTPDRHGHALNASNLVSPIMLSPTASTASDSRISARSGGTGTFPANPANVRPLAAYVAHSGAAQVVSEHQTARSGAVSSDDEDEHKPSKDDVSFSPPALALINAFLDQLLFSFLSTARATTVSALRPAVVDILRHKLARDAIASANEELADLLAGGDEEEEKESKNIDRSKWDIDLVWRRTRLRVMVYMRLGEMEDDDEERHVKEQGLSNKHERSRFSSSAGLVSWSAAIFLTSVLEHVAEQTLKVAGAAAFHRVRTSEDRSTSKGVVVEDGDAERIALDPALGRLWRSWRKTMRANVQPPTPIPRDQPTVASPAKSVSTLRDSFGTAPESAQEDDEPALKYADLPDTKYPEHVLAANIRLPMGDPLRDVDEIEVPGLARDPDEVVQRELAAQATERRRSFSSYQSRQAEAKALSGPPGLPDEDDNTKPQLLRKRSTSVPAPYRNMSEAFASEQASAHTNGEALPNGVVPAESINDGPVYGPVEQKDFDFTIDEIDKRKSLIDIKALLAAINGDFVPFATKDGQDHDRPTSARSDQSFSLGNKENGVISGQPLAERQHMGNAADEIGVATTSDQAVAPERVPSANGARTISPSPSPMLVSRTSSVARSKYSPSPVEDARLGMATDEAPARDRPIAPNEQTLAALRESVHRASSPQAAQQDTTEQQAQNNRKSMVTQYPISAFNSMTQLNQTPEHPHLQQKRAQDSKRMTQSSIRDPEDFDQFVQSDEVVKYTLTPEPIRETPASNADALAQLSGHVPPVIQTVPSTETTESHPGRNQVAKSMTAAPGEELSEAEKKRRRWSVIRPPSRNSTVHRRSGLMAREARVVTESTRDFADFIRSTKPTKEPQVVPLVGVQPRNSTNYSLPRSQSLTGERTKSLTRSDIAAGYAPPVPLIPGKSRPVMQPKSATGTSEETGELIAFIRDGPKVDGESRISRSVAPFRTTMDSDQFDALRSNPTTSTAPKSNPSARASMSLTNGNGNAGSVAHPAYSGQRQSIHSTQTQANDPQRKQYRNKDPYAIDLDDDEEDISALPKGKRGGETMAEFLRSDETGKGGDSRPIASASSLAQAREIMERARARGSQTNTHVDGVTALPTGVARSDVRPASAGRSGSRQPGQSDAKDLADFLRESGPPSSAPGPTIGRGVQAQNSSQVKDDKQVKQKKSRGFFGFFRRGTTKNKPTQHADMP